MIVYEYRITWAHEHHPDLRMSGMTFRSDNEMWTKYVPEILPEDGGMYEGVGVGLDAIIESTCREEENKGKKDVRVERRRVEPWEDYPRKRKNRNA